MELSISEEKTKTMLTDVVVELMETKRSVFYDIVLEALEDVGMAHAIAEGKKGKYVSEDEIFSILEAKAEFLNICQIKLKLAERHRAASAKREFSFTRYWLWG